MKPDPLHLTHRRRGTLTGWALLACGGCTGAIVPQAGSSEGTGSTGDRGSSSGGGTTSTPDGTTDTTSSPEVTSSPDSSAGPGGGEDPPVFFDVGGVASGTGSTGGGETGVVIDWDCDDLVQPFESEAELGAPRGYHDVYFDDDGHILGWDGNAIIAVTYEDELSVFLPGVNSAQGMDVLDDGDLLYLNDFGELRRVTPDQQASTIANGFSGAYGVTVGPDQRAYVCWSYGVTRVDPESGESEPFLTLPGGATPRTLVFNLDSSGAFMSTLLAPQSPVYYVELDGDLDPAGDPVVFATGVGQGYHDGLGIDACGNLYVPDYITSGLYRIDPDGVVTTVFSGGGAGLPHYGHGLEWGSGIDGWNDRAIYLPQPYDGWTVLEVVLGVPSGSLVRTWK